MTNNQAAQFANRWLSAWNSSDVREILMLFSEDFTNSTPLLQSLHVCESGTLAGKQANGEYWESLLKKHPVLNTSAEKIWAGVDSVAILWRFTAPGLDRSGLDVFTFGADGLVERVATHY